MPPEWNIGSVVIVVSNGVMPTGVVMFTEFQKVFACVSTAPFGRPVVPAV